MKKRIALICLVLTMCLVGCNQKEVSNTTPEGQVSTEGEHLKPEDSLEDIVEETKSAEPSVEDTEEEQLRVEPLPSVYNLNALEDCKLAVSLDKTAMYIHEDTSKYMLRATVYDYELFDLVDISQLEVGDIIVLNTKDVLVDKIETLENGDIVINGGLDVGGYELRTDDNGVYYEIGYSDVKSYYSIGDIELPLSKDFKFVDESNDEEHITVLSAEETEKLIFEHEGYYTPHNTSIIIENGKITEMKVIYTP